MNRVRVMALVLICGSLVLTPAAALHARYLEIAIGRDGNATVTFEYTLPWIEQGLAFIGAVNPDRDLGQILAAATGGEVRILARSPGATTFSVMGFAAVSGASPHPTYTTAALNLSWGEAGYRSSILAPLLEPDFSPDTTVARFPDAYSVTFSDQLVIPSVTHAT